MYTFLVAVFEQGFFATIIKNLDKGVKWLVLRIVRPFVKIDPKKIMFINFTGNYDCNPKYICQQVLDEKIDAHIVWSIYKNTRTGPQFFPRGVKCVIRNTYNFYREMMSAHIIVDNGIGTSFVGYPKKRGQILIETWHGSLGIKKFGVDSNRDKKWIRMAYREGRMTDYIISNSDMEDDIYREDFWKKTTIWKYGHARNDILFTEDQARLGAIRRELFDAYEIPMNAQLCMYAPTFRDDGDLSPYTIDYARLSDALTERFGGKWVILTRFHSRTKKYIKSYTLPKNVYNVSGYPDIQELMVVIDAGITDYSSWICEYMLRRKPGFTFATDVQNYANHQRELFFPLSALPFPTAADEDTLISNILSFDNEQYVAECDAFLKEKGSIDDGHAAERIANEIRVLLGK